MILSGIHESLWKNQRPTRTVKAAEPHRDIAVHIFRPSSGTLCRIKFIPSPVGGISVSRHLASAPLPSQSLIRLHFSHLAAQQDWQKHHSISMLVSFLSLLSKKGPVFVLLRFGISQPWTSLCGQDNGDKGRSSNMI